MTGTLQIRDIAFEVDSQRSVFFASIPQEPPGKESPGLLNWSLEVYCVNKKNERGIAAPFLYANGMVFGVRDWKSIEGHTVQNEGEKGLAAYVDDGQVNERTADNSIRFLARRGNLFTIEWECSAYVVSGETAARWLLRLQTEIAFDGVHIWWVKADAQGLATVRELVGRNFDLGCLQEPEIAGPYHIVFPPRLQDAA